VVKDWEAYFWEPLGECYEQESRGPCQEGQYFAFNATARREWSLNNPCKIGLNKISTF
jgi:hypothetical protein